MITPQFEYPTLTRSSVDGSRRYLLPDGSRVPSVTTILDKTKPEESRRALAAWRDRVGHARAQEITTEAANRGTRMHSYLDEYIKNNNMSKFPSNPYAQTSWFMAAQIILEGFPKVEEFWGMEVSVYYEGLYAGTTDCVGIWKGKPAIIDFKQSNRIKERDDIPDYFMQLAAYANAHNNMFGTDIKSGVILMCIKPKTNQDTPEYREFEILEDQFEYWSNQWSNRVEEFYRIRDDNNLD
jgi:hypothetical protein